MVSPYSFAVMLMFWLSIENIHAAFSATLPPYQFIIGQDWEFLIPDNVVTFGIKRVFQGWASAVSGTGMRAIWGGISDTNRTGAAWIYGKNPSTGKWEFEAKLVGPKTGDISLQGGCVTIDYSGTLAAVGGHGDNNFTGAVYVYRRSDHGKWSLIQKVTGEDADFTQTGSTNPNFRGVWQGAACSLKGSTLVFGGYNDNSYTGAIWTFEMGPDGRFHQVGSKFPGPGGPNSQFGSSVSLSADQNTVVVGSQEYNRSGATYVLTRTGRGSKWSASAPILAREGSFEGNQGNRVAVSNDGNTFVTGAYEDDDYAGGAWVFERTKDGWREQAYLVGSNLVNDVGAQNGVAVAISAKGNLIAVGAHHDSNYIGATWLFGRNSTSGGWSQIGSKLVGPGYVRADDFRVEEGTSLGLDDVGNTLIVGAQKHNNTGGVFIFDLKEYLRGYHLG